MIRDGKWNFLGQWFENIGIMLLFLFFLVPSECRAAAQTIGNVENPAEGSLKILVYDPADSARQMEVWRFVSGAWQYQFFSEDAKDSMLQINGVRFSLGGYYGGDLAVLISNSTDQNGSKITSAYKVAGNDALITQETTYQPGAAYYDLRWTITNVGNATLEDLRLFHGGDTYFEGDDSGGGFWDATNNTIGVQHTAGAQINRMSLQGSTAPYAYESRNYGSVKSSVNNGALTNVIDPNEDTDNGYALEWRRATLGVGESWTIQAFEKFGDAMVGGPLVYAPTQTDGDPGSFVDLVFSVENTSPDTQATNLTVSLNQSGWNAAILSPVSPISMPGNSTQKVVVRVTIPTTAEGGMIGMVTLEATANSITSSDNAALKITQPAFQSQTESAGTGVESYRLVSIPLLQVPGGDLEAAISSGIPADWTFGADGDIRIIRWVNIPDSAPHYEELLGAPPAFRQVSDATGYDLAGLGFWRIVRQEQVFEYDGEASSAGSFSINLEPGWNIFGFPFSNTSQISLNNIYISNDSTDGKLIANDSQHIASHSIWEYEDRDNDSIINDDSTDNSLYDRASYIARGYAYWLWVNDQQTGAITLKINNIARTVGSAGSGRTVLGSRTVLAADEPPPPAPPAQALNGSSTGSSSAAAGGGCFIATAAFGSPVEKHVALLKKFRDQCLLPTSMGKDFVLAYYRYSPPVADYIAVHESLKTVVRWSLMPLIGTSWLALQIGLPLSFSLLLLMIAGTCKLLLLRPKSD